MAQTRDIKYVNRDFNNLRNQLIEYSKNYFSDTYNDFSPTSPGMMFMEMAAYVGDVLSFYQDLQVQETYIQYAKDPKNLLNLAYMMGYRPKLSSVSEVMVQITQIIDPSPSDNLLPDWSKATKVLENAQLQASVGSRVQFFTNESIDFSFSSSFSPTRVAVNEYDGTGNPLSFALTKLVKAYSGEVKTTSRPIQSAEKYLTLVIDDLNIIGVRSIVDNDGNGDTWYEVPFLGQETVFVEERNTSSDSNVVYNKLSLRKVDKRFITRFDNLGRLIIQFGAGVIPGEDSEIVPSLENVGLGTNTGISRLDYAYDPSNFLYTRSYGLAPSNTTLQIKYLVGGGISANVPANTINSALSITTVGGDPSASSRIVVTNPSPAAGGSDRDSPEEIRQNAIRAFNEQGRVVTLQDYLIRSYSLPSTLGTIAKVYAIQDQLTNINSTTDSIIDSNPLSISLYTLAYDSNRRLISSTMTLKENLKTYLSQYMLLTDAINIKDAFIINIGLDYEIVIYPDQVGREVLLNCNNALIDYFDISKWNINQPINLSDVYLLLDRIKGVQTVKSVKISNKAGGSYSPYGYDIKGATRANTIFPSLDPSIFEIKFPNSDIRGRLTTL